jgi:hypothetical protein
MSILDKWILTRAKKIENRKKLEEDLFRNSRDEIRNSRNLASEILRRKILKESNKILSTNSHINPGDNAILNVYSLGREGANGWDGGPASLIKNIPESELENPVTVKITEIYTDLSLADERVDMFLDHVEEKIKILVKNEDSLISSFESWLNNRSSKYTFDNIYGIYRTAYFEYSGSFKPKWGLSVNSFLKEGTPEYEKTYSLWKRELDLNRKISMLSKELADLNIEREEIKREIFN